MWNLVFKKDKEMQEQRKASNKSRQVLIKRFHHLLNNIRRFALFLHFISICSHLKHLQSRRTAHYREISYLFLINTIPVTFTKLKISICMKWMNRSGAKKRIIIFDRIKLDQLTAFENEWWRLKSTAEEETSINTMTIHD